MSRTVLPLLTTVVTLMSSPFIVAENLVANGSFEVPYVADGNFWYATNGFSPWQGTEKSLEIWAKGFRAGQSAFDGRQFLEILAFTRTNSIWQSVPTVAGEDYALSFAHSPRPGEHSSLTVSLDGQVIVTLDEDGRTLTNHTWRVYSTNFTASSMSTTVMFTDRNPLGSAGTHIDRVAVEALALRTVLRVSEVELCWETVSPRNYQVQYRSVLTADDWVGLGTPVQGNGSTACIRDAVPVGEPQRYYRVVTVP